MKFQATILAAALGVANFYSAYSFAPSNNLQSRQEFVGKSKLNMVATVDEVVGGIDGDMKPRKTRKVR